MFRLESPDQDQENRWPDLAAQCPDRILLIELKTESGIVRERQVDEYLELGLLHYPHIDGQLLYVTRDRVPTAPAGLPGRAGYATLTWTEAAHAIDEVFGDASGDDGVNSAAFVAWIRDELMTGAPWTPPAKSVGVPASPLAREPLAPPAPLPSAAVPPDDEVLAGGCTSRRTGC